MTAAWDAAKEYLIGQAVTHGGHTYVWSSANDSAGVEPPAGSWVGPGWAPAVAGLPAPAAGDAGKVVTVKQSEDGYDLEAGQSGASVAAVVGYLYVGTPDDGDSPGTALVAVDGAGFNQYQCLAVPVYCGAGGTFKVVSADESGNKGTSDNVASTTHAIKYASVFVTNGAGTEQLVISNSVQQPLGRTGDGTPQVTFDPAGAFGTGTGITCDGETFTVAAAGVYFLRVLVILVAL